MGANDKVEATFHPGTGPTKDPPPHKIDPDYQRKHKKMRKVNGKASRWICEHCDSVASDWAQIHGSDGWDPEEDYMALCRSCHLKYDMTDDWKEKSAKSRRGQKRTEEQRKRLSAAHLGKGTKDVCIRGHDLTNPENRIWGWGDCKPCRDYRNSKEYKNRNKDEGTSGLGR